jgi:hypothetical protein
MSSASAGRARPFPNGWREGFILAQFVAGNAAATLCTQQDDPLWSIAASGDQCADASARLAMAAPRVATRFARIVGTAARAPRRP